MSPSVGEENKTGHNYLDRVTRCPNVLGCFNAPDATLEEARLNVEKAHTMSAASSKKNKSVLTSVNAIFSSRSSAVNNENIVANPQD